MIIQTNTQQIEKIKDNNFFRRKPGWLIQKGQLMLHTHIGIAYGRKLLRCSERIRSLWQAAKEDNPYADWYLLKIEDAMLTLSQELIRWEQHCQQQLVTYPDIQIELVMNQKPLVMPLYFLNLYNFRIAILIGHFDRLARYTLSLKNLNLDTSEPVSKVFQEYSTSLRMLFEILNQWKFFKVTREDIQQNNVTAQATQIHFNIKLDVCILSGEIRPELIAKKK